MLKLSTLALAAALGLALMPAAQAAPGSAVSPNVPAGVQLVSGGCGPGGHRDFRGYCRPNAPVYRRCPYGFHPTPYGCRRNY